MESKMQRDNQFFRIDPVCRFGPGGDFVKNWPGNPQDYLKNPQNPLTKLLFSINKLIKATQENQEQYSVNITEDKNAIQPHTKAVPASSGDNDIQGQTLLFADDCRTGTGTVNKQKHRVRAHRRTAKKKPTLRITGQGSLFDADKKSVKTA
jgi:hypothetical protein